MLVSAASRTGALRSTSTSPWIGLKSGQINFRQAALGEQIAARSPADIKSGDWIQWQKRQLQRIREKHDEERHGVPSRRAIAESRCASRTQRVSANHVGRHVYSFRRTGRLSHRQSARFAGIELPNVMVLQGSNHPRAFQFADGQVPRAHVFSRKPGNGSAEQANPTMTTNGGSACGMKSRIYFYPICRSFQFESSSPNRSRGKVPASKRTSSHSGPRVWPGLSQ